MEALYIFVSVIAVCLTCISLCIYGIFKNIKEIKLIDKEIDLIRNEKE